MPSDREFVAAYMRRHGQLLAGVEAQVLALWDALSGHNRDDVAGFVAQVVPVIERHQLAAGQAVDGFVARLAQQPVVGLTPVDVVDVRNGVSLAEVYERPFLRAWAEMANGTPRDKAIASARSYLGGMAQMDVQLSTSHAMAQVSDAQPNVVGYRRVLTGQGCVFCAVASTQRYRTGDLRPLHFRCDCGVAPIIGTRDPGRVMNQDLLDKLKARGPKYWDDKGFVDASGEPLDPTRLPKPPRPGVSGEIGPVI